MELNEKTVLTFLDPVYYKRNEKIYVGCEEGFIYIGRLNTLRNDIRKLSVIRKAKLSNIAEANESLANAAIEKVAQLNRADRKSKDYFEKVVQASKIALKATESAMATREELKSFIPYEKRFIKKLTHTKNNEWIVIIKGTEKGQFENEKECNLWFENLAENSILFTKRTNTHS